MSEKNGEQHNRVVVCTPEGEPLRPGTREYDDTVVPYIGELMIELQEHVASRIDQWEAEGKDLQLPIAMLTLEMEGDDLPPNPTADEDAKQKWAITTAMKGPKGQPTNVEELLDALGRTLAGICGAQGYRDPFETLNAFEAVARGLVAALDEVAKAGESKRRTAKGMLGILHGYLDTITTILETGSLPTKVQPDSVKNAEDLSAEDFGGE